MAYTTKNKIITLILTLLMFVTLTFGQGNLPVFSLVAKAASSSYEESNVLDDLLSSSNFNLLNFSRKENGNIQLISFIEYCYSYRKNTQNDYEMYIIIYNPSGLDIETKSYQNKIQLAVEYGDNNAPIRFEKFRLEFCNKSTTGEYKNLFYKFRVVDRQFNGKYFEDRVASNARRYDISGIELLIKGNQNAVDYNVSSTYVFTGYAKGYGKNANDESSLKCSVTKMETLRINVDHTNYRTNVSSLGADHYNEVNSVYFSIPNRIYEQYGYLQKIRAEWWEYKTKMIAVTSNQDFYSQLLQYIGTDVGYFDEKVPVYLYSGYKGKASMQIGIPTYHYYDWCYNKNLETQYTIFGTPSAVYETNSQSSIMPYVFYSPIVDVDKVFSFLYTEPSAGSVEESILKDWIYNYENNLGNGYIDCNGRRISVDLFEDYVDSGRIMGHNDKTIDLSDTFDLDSYDSNHSWVDKLLDYGFSWPNTGGDYHNVLPIYEIRAEDLLGTDEEVASSLLINVNDINKIRAYYAAEKAKGNRIVLFRFANTDYYAAPAYTSSGSTLADCDTYVAQQSVFLDFDIIELTFNGDGIYYVIPAVSNPIDIVNDITPPGAQFEWWKIALAIIMLVLIIIAIYPIIPYLLNLIWWLIKQPAKMFRKIIIRLKRRKKQN